MSFFEQSRYFFNYILPDIILNNLDQLSSFLSYYWWVYILLIILLFVLLMKLFTKNVNLKTELIKWDKYYKSLAKQSDIKDIESFILKSAKIVNAKYASLYELRGETYILLESNVSNDKSISAPIRVGKKELKRWVKSGNYQISYFLDEEKNYMILFYSSHEIKYNRYIGNFAIILGYYALSVKATKSRGSLALTSINKETSLSLMKLQMDKYQFFKFFIALIIKLTKAKGAKLYKKTGELVLEYGKTEGINKQKDFYIRNTPYKLEYYDDKTLDMNTISKIGSFLDMSGAFMENIDKNSEMVKNYLDLLKFTNKAIELENIYYKNHSLIVQTVSVELAKSLFLTEEEIDNISLGAYLHDIGMVGDLLAMLNKDNIEEQEKDLIKEHPLIGSIMVEPISHIYPITNIIKYHHERFDGRGYPFGLKEAEIPIEAQIVAVGEFYAGITGDRSYKKGKTHQEALEEIVKLKNKMFNPTIVDVFVEISNSIKTKIDKIKAKKEENEG